MRIDAVMKPWANEDTPGCAVAVIQDGEVIYAKGYGMADLEHGVPITPETVFEIASTSKQFTVAAVLLAASEGKLQLDDDVRVHVPALPKLGETPTTIRHLILHTGGLRDFGLLLMLAGHRVEGVTTVEETIDMLARQRGRDFEPGTKMKQRLAADHTRRGLADQNVGLGTDSLRLEARSQSLSSRWPQSNALRS